MSDKPADVGLQITIEVKRYPSGEPVGRFLSTILPFDFFILNQNSYAQTLNTFMASTCRDYQEAVNHQSKTGYPLWPQLKQLFDQLSKSQVKPEQQEEQQNEDQAGEEWKDQDS